MNKSLTKQTQCNFAAEKAEVRIRKSRDKSFQIDRKPKTLIKATQTLLERRPKTGKSVSSQTPRIKIVNPEDKRQETPTHINPVKFVEPELTQTQPDVELDPEYFINVEIKPELPDWADDSNSVIKPDLEEHSEKALLEHPDKEFLLQNTKCYANTQTDIFDIFYKSHEKEILENLIESINTPQHVFSIIVEKCINLNLDLQFRKNVLGERTVTVTNSAYFGLIQNDIDPLTAIFYENGKANLNIIFQPIRVFDLSPTTNSDWKTELENILNMIDGKNYVYCPGIKYNGTERRPRNTVLHSAPFKRLQSDQCPVWYTEEKVFARKVVKCVSCNRSTNTMAKGLKRNVEESPSMKNDERTKVKSKCASKYGTKRVKTMRLKNSSCKNRNKGEQELEHQSISSDHDSSTDSYS